MSNVSKMPPQQAGWYEFNGLRTTPSGKFIVTVRDLVKVIPGATIGTFGVQTAGSAQCYSTSMYSGIWVRISVDFSEAKETSA